MIEAVPKYRPRITNDEVSSSWSPSDVLSLSKYDSRERIVSRCTKYSEVHCKSMSYVCYCTRLKGIGQITKEKPPAGGQRIYKRVGNNAPEYYIMDGMANIAVITTNQVENWNILSGGKVAGRMESDGTTYFYTTDHLGSTRAVTDASGTAIEGTDYYPFGLVMSGRQSTSGDPAKEGFTSKERDAETGLDYFGARFYMPSLGRWNGIDPLSDQYPSHSPYNYVMNNPLSLVDPNGEIVVYADGVSNSFKEAFAEAVQYLNEKGAAGMLAKLNDSEEVYIIGETSGGSSFNPKNQTISWDPTQALFTNESKVLSPTSILNHEVDHALQFDQNPEQQKADGKEIDNDYGNKEEERVITGSEQDTALKLGEIEKGEVTRTDHFGLLFTTLNVRSTKEKDPLYATPQDNDDD